MEGKKYIILKRAGGPYDNLVVILINRIKNLTGATNVPSVLYNTNPNVMFDKDSLTVRIGLDDFIGMCERLEYKESGDKIKLFGDLRVNVQHSLIYSLFEMTMCDMDRIEEALTRVNPRVCYSDKPVCSMFESGLMHVLKFLSTDVNVKKHTPKDEELKTFTYRFQKDNNIIEVEASTDWEAYDLADNKVDDVENYDWIRL